MYLLKIAFRNLFRNFRRSLLTMSTIFIGVMGFVLSSAMVRGVERSFIRIDIETESGHLRIIQKGYLEDEENFPLDMEVKNLDKLRTSLQKKWPNAVIVERIIFSVDLSDGVNTVKARAIAIDPKIAEQAFSISKNSRQKKELPVSGQVILMGNQLLQTFGKKIGETLTLVTRTRAGSFNALDFRIFDTIDAGNMLINSFTIYMPMQTARTLLQMKAGVTDLVIRLKQEEEEDALTMATWVHKQTPENQAQAWQEKAQMILEMNRLRRRIMNFLILIVLLVAAAGIANTILMSGYERKGEIGMMLAMGLSGSRIVWLFALEAGALGMIGSAFGSVIGGACSYYMQVHGWDFSKTMGSMDALTGSGGGMSFSNVIYFYLTPQAMVFGFLIGILVATIAALWPAWRLTRLEPREILGGG